MQDKYLYLLLGFGIGFFGARFILRGKQEEELKKVSEYIHNKTWNEAHENFLAWLQDNSRNGVTVAQMHDTLLQSAQS